MKDEKQATSPSTLAVCVWRGENARTAHCITAEGKHLHHILRVAHIPYLRERDEDMLMFECACLSLFVKESFSKQKRGVVKVKVV